MTKEKEKLGFNGQWIDVITTGTHIDNAGQRREIDHAFLEKVVSNFSPELHEPPAVIGHPKTDAPAFAWVCGLRIEKRDNDEALQAQFCNSDPTFEQLVEEGKFKKRSVALYLDPQIAPGGRVPSLRHVGFLGAQTPAVKGLRNIKFNEGEAVTFDINFSEGESMDEEKVKSTVMDSIREFFAPLLGRKDETPQATFSEAELDARIKAATDAVTATITEKFTALESVNKSLQDRLDNQSGSATRTEIIAFCERLGSGKFLPAFRSMGVIEFMETLASIPDEKKVAVITFSEAEGKTEKVEIAPLEFFKKFLQSLPSFVEFGEQLGDLKVKSEVDITDPQGVEKLRAGMGIQKEGGDK